MALEWLKTILGDTYTEDIDAKVSKEIGAHFVAKADFNTVNEDKKLWAGEKKRLEDEIRTRDGQLEKLKNSGADVETLKQTIASLQADNVKEKARFDAELTQERLNNAVDKALTTAGAKNNIAAKALLTEFLKDAKLGEDGTVKGLAAELDVLVKAESTSFMFQSAPDGTTPQLKGLTPGNPGGSPPPSAKSPKDMSYEELAIYMEQNPNAEI